jgi:hypothetical protein
MINSIIFFVYFLIIGFFILKYSSNKVINLSRLDCLILFSIKVTVGVLYANYFTTQDQIVNADTWTYFIDSKLETDFLVQNPLGFVKDLFSVKYQSSGGLFSSTYSYWNDLKANFFIKILAVLNLLSNKNYYVNLLFFNWLFLYGGLLLIKLVNEYYSIKKHWLLISIFLAPSALFWCSAVHKDGIVFTASVALIYCFIKILNTKGKPKHYFYLAIATLVLFALRNYYLLAIFPALLAYFLLIKLKLKSSIIFLVIVAGFFGILFVSGTFKPISFIANSIVNKHDDFAALEGNSKFATPTLNASVYSLINYFPFAFKVAFLHPLVNINLGLKYFLIGFENLIYLLLIIATGIKLLFTKAKSNPLVLTLFSISFLLSMFIGYIVCFDAAIIRYRSCFLPLLLVGCVLVLFGKPKNNLIN